MAFVYKIAFVALLFAYGQAIAATCVNPRIRKSWHHLSVWEKQDYIKAVTCLWQKPAQGGAYFPGVKTRHDDFASLHINQTTAPDLTGNVANFGLIGPGIHFNGVFLPWHRYAVWTYESILINECGYKGAQPYWDWSLDTSEYNSTLEESPIFDPVNGFGGNSRDGSVPAPLPGPPSNTSGPAETPIYGNCIGSGPFEKYNSTLGPGYNLDKPDSHCIIRNFNGTIADQSLQWNRNILPLLSETYFFNFSVHFDRPVVPAPVGIHGAGHSAVGGEMSNVWSSINDPLFWMHHAQIDHVWAIWQSLSPANAEQINGPVYPNGTGTVTYDTPLYMAPFVAPDAKIADVMDTKNKDGNGVLCYVYADDNHTLPQGVL